MARRIRIPWLLDLVLVDDAAQMRALNRHPAVSRTLPASGGLVNRLVARRILSTLVVGASPLPTFTAREAPGRAVRQARLERRLEELAAHPGPLEPEIDRLADYVAGRAPGLPLGVVAQQAVGRMFSPHYEATPETYAAAQLLAAWPRANPLKALWWRRSGRLALSRSLLWDRAGHDTQAVHATTIDVHNLVEALERMREAARRWGGPGSAGVGSVVASCLVAPEALLRAAVEEARIPFLRRPLRPGTLVVFRLSRMHRASADAGLAFAEGEWSQCPAHALVPRLLEAIWVRAMGLEPVRQRRRA